LASEVTVTATLPSAVPPLTETRRVRGPETISGLLFAEVFTILIVLTHGVCVKFTKALLVLFDDCLQCLRTRLCVLRAEPNHSINLDLALEFCGPLRQRSRERSRAPEQNHIPAGHHYVQ